LVEGAESVQLSSLLGVRRTPSPSDNIFGYLEARQRLVAAEIDMTTEQKAEAIKLAKDLYATLPAGGS
jgi:hypothetical protein